MNSTEDSGSLKETTAEKGGISLSEQRQPEKESIERKSYDWYEKQIKQSDEKVKDAKFEQAKQPENQERKDALEKALNEKTALVLERDFGVSSPKLVDLRRQQENLGDVQKHFSEHIALNEAFKAELAQLQESLPKDFISARHQYLLQMQRKYDEQYTERNTKSTELSGSLKENKLPEKVITRENLSIAKQEIEKALNSPSLNTRLRAIHHPNMQPEWLEKVVEKHRCPETVCEAKNALQEKAVAKQFSGSMVAIIQKPPTQLKNKTRR